MVRIVWLIGLAVLLLVGSPPGSGAQGTPVAADCVAEPLNGDELEEIVASGFAPAPDLTETGEPASAQELVAIFEVISESVACTNANQPLSALALYSDRYLAERFSGPAGEDELGHLLAAATRSPGHATPEDRLVVLSIADAVRYGDGRIGATVTTANADAVYIDLIVLVETNDGWRIDQVVLGDGLSGNGTPAASGEEP